MKYDSTGPMASAFAGLYASADREAVTRRSCAMIAQTCDPVSNTLLVTGTVYYVGLALVAGDVVSTIQICISVVGSGMTASLVGLYDSVGNLLATSADQGTNWQTAGIKSIALTSAYTVTVTGWYYVAIFCTASTTLPTITRGGIAVNSPQTDLLGGMGGPTALRRWSSQTGQSGLPNPGTPQATGTAPSQLWAVVY